jgi:hypothetical protein
MCVILGGNSIILSIKERNLFIVWVRAYVASGLNGKTMNIGCAD